MSDDISPAILNSTSLAEFLQLGQQVKWLLDTGSANVGQTSTTYPLVAGNHHSNQYQYGTVRDGIAALNASLEQHGFTNALAAARPLIEIHNRIIAHLKDRPGEVQARLPEEWSNRVLSYAASVNTTLSQEAKSRQLIQLDLSAVTKVIATWPDVFDGTALAFTEWQTAMWEDTIRCLRTSAYRPSIVMGWGLGFDMIRFWVFRDDARRADFNTELQIRQNGATIIDYRDFFQWRENLVLDYCRLAGNSLSGFTDKTFRRLQTLLDGRNDAAHANFKTVTAPVAQGYLESLVGILVDSPFR